MDVIDAFRGQLSSEKPHYVLFVFNLRTHRPNLRFQQSIKALAACGVRFHPDNVFIYANNRPKGEDFGGGWGKFTEDRVHEQMDSYEERIASLLKGNEEWDESEGKSRGIPPRVKVPKENRFWGWDRHAYPDDAGDADDAHNDVCRVTRASCIWDRIRQTKNVVKPVTIDGRPLKEMLREETAVADRWRETLERLKREMADLAGMISNLEALQTEQEKLEEMREAKKSKERDLSHAQREHAEFLRKFDPLAKCAAHFGVLAERDRGGPSPPTSPPFEY